MVEKHWVLEVQPDLRALASTRHAVRDYLARSGMSHTEEAELVVDELVVNAIVHAGGDIRVTVECGQGRTLVTVHDGSRVIPAPAPLHRSRSGGRGLRIVEALAARWGVDPRSDGKNVWVELAGGAH